VLLPFVLALVVAYVLEPVVAKVETARIPRWIAILLTYGVTLGSMYGFGHLIAPRIGIEAASLRREIPGIITRIRAEWLPRLDAYTRPHGEPPPEDPEREGAPSAVRILPGPNGTYDIYIGRGFDVKPIGENSYRVDQADSPRPLEEGLPERALAQAVAYGRENTLALLRFGQQVVAAVSRAIFVFFITLMLAAYLMLTRERIYGFFRNLCTPNVRVSYDDLMARIDRGLSGVVRGQLLICLVNGVLSAIGFAILGLKYWPILSIVAGVMSIVPIFGSILSSVPAVAIALTQSMGTAVGVLAWIVGIHQLEANFLNPKIIGDAAKIHPVLVVFSLVVGEHLFRLPGALLAVPCMSLLQSLFLHFRNVAYEEDAPPDSFRPPRPVADDHKA
jgi:predicted PurR-regulated permease PerM